MPEISFLDCRPDYMPKPQMDDLKLFNTMESRAVGYNMWRALAGPYWPVRFLQSLTLTGLLQRKLN